MASRQVEVTFSPERHFTNLFALHHILSPLFKPWQLVTHLFLHGSLMHIFSKCLPSGCLVPYLKISGVQKRFLLFYLLCGLGAAVLHLGSLWYESMPLLNDLRNLKSILRRRHLYNFSIHISPTRKRILMP
jgi:membrane associated rhomboid family serine protease